MPGSWVGRPYPDIGLFESSRRTQINIHQQDRMPMKTLFLGGLAARVAPRILDKMTEKVDHTILADLTDMQRLIPALDEAEIVVGHIWRKEFPEASRVGLLQAATAGIDMIDVPALPRGITVCNVFGHEPAIAEYVLAATLALTLRLVSTVSEFRAGSWGRTNRPVDRRTEKFLARRSALSATAGLAVMSPPVRLRSAARLSPSIAARSPTEGPHRRFIPWSNSIGCCRNATCWLLPQTSGQKPAGLSTPAACP
jgi:hypothetical protein